jgi:hypothetical protein
MKANGVLVIDTGRQLVSPKELLKRWIFPMEGASIICRCSIARRLVLFGCCWCFRPTSANQLGDEAFFRRIRHKIEVGDPDEASFLEILRRSCDQHSIPYADAAGRYLI